MSWWEMEKLELEEEARFRKIKVQNSGCRSLANAGEMQPHGSCPV
jgi:hypothetical protein